MFVERSAARIRLVRILFVLVCLLPTVGLVGWAAYRRSSLSRDSLLSAWSRTLGVAVTADSVENIRPAVMRLRNVALTTATNRFLLGVEVVEVETRDQGSLVRLPSLAIDQTGVTTLARLSLAWLTEAVRFPEGGVIEVDSLTWGAAGLPQPQGGFRIEFVVADTGRAIRIRREPADSDELRLRAVASPAGLRLEAELIAEQGLPADLAAAVAGWLPNFGDAAVIRGSLQATATPKTKDGGGWRWSGGGQGVVTDVALSELAEAAGQQANGEAVLQIEDLAVEDSRIAAARMTLSATEGELGRGLVERLITVFGCRLGPAAATLVTGEAWMAGPPLAFDEASFAVSLDRSGVTLRGVGAAGDTLALLGGRGLLETKSTKIGYDRFAWLFAPMIPGAIPATIPASPRAVEVLSHLPEVPEAPAGRF